MGPRGRAGCTGRWTVSALSAQSALAVGALVALLAGCGSPGATSGPATTTATTATTTASAASPTAEDSPTPGVAPATYADRCGIDRTVTGPMPTPFTFRTADGVTLVGAEFGAGPRGVVAVHQIGPAGLCGWGAYARYLAARGFHVLTFDERCVGLSTCPDGPSAGDLLTDVAAGRAELVRRGATTTALLGASQGGGVAIAAAGSQTGWSRAVVLSGAILETDFGGGVTATSAMPDVAVPTLFVVGDADPDSPLATDRALLARARPGVVTLSVVKDGGHGWSLLQPLPGDPFTATAEQVANFLAG